MSTKYQNSVLALLHGDSEAAAHDSFKERDVWQRSSDEVLERNLIAFRLAMKSGNMSDSVENLNEERTANQFLKAELLFVKGSFYGQTSSHELASASFAKAAHFYALENKHDRVALSLFNKFIADTYREDLDLNEERSLAEIQEYCSVHDIPKVQFLCDRHLSFRHFERGEFSLAIEKMILWVARADVLAKSDSQLALLHIADCFWELKDLRKALLYFDQVKEDIDERVRFPKAFIEAKLWQKSLDLHSFPMVTDHWRQRYLNSSLAQQKQSAGSIRIKSAELVWSHKTGMIARGKKIQGKIKTHSLEGQLLRLLAAGPRSKVLICESLWPTEMATEFLDDRFHQLIQRVQRKVNGLVLFDGTSYRLSEHLQSL